MFEIGQKVSGQFLNRYPFSGVVINRDVPYRYPADHFYLIRLSSPVQRPGLPPVLDTLVIPYPSPDHIMEADA